MGGFKRTLMGADYLDQCARLSCSRPKRLFGLNPPKMLVTDTPRPGSTGNDYTLISGCVYRASNLFFDHYWPCAVTQPITETTTMSLQILEHMLLVQCFTEELGDYNYCTVDTWLN